MEKTSKREIIIIAIISLGFILLPFVFGPSSNSNPNFYSSSFFKRMIFENSLLVVFFIVNYFVFISKLYLKKKYFLYLILIISCFIVINLITDFFFPIERRPFGNPYQIRNLRPRRAPLFMIWSPKILMFACITLISVLVQQRRVFQEVKIEKQLSEIAYLRAQINPHFLFNTLNSIYALTLQKSDNAPDAVMKLSKMMRYVVTDSAAEFISLQKDIDYIKNYIQLQQLRLLNKDAIIFNVNGTFTNYNITPLLLINFVENAFKYGVIDEVNEPIKINISIDNGILDFEVQNKISEHVVDEDDKSLTGISNSKKRLAHYYPTNHELEISQNEEIFKVKLKLNLND